MHELKASGVSNFGLVPSHWSVLKLKSILRIKSVKSGGLGELLSVYLHQGVIRHSESTGMQVHKPSLDLSNYQKVSVGNFVLNNQQAWRGSVGISTHDGIISPAYLVCETSEKHFPKYLNYVFRSSCMVQQYETASRGVGSIQRNLYAPYLLNCGIVLPPAHEQHLIAAYLDTRCAELDKLREDILSQVETLEQYRKSVISEAVTKGLDSTAEMTDSGVDYIGWVPKGWHISKLGYLGWLQNGISKEAKAFGSGSPFVSYKDVYNNHILPEYVEGLVESTQIEQNQYSVQRGDAFFTRTSETIEEIGFSSVCMHTIENATFAGFLIRFRPSSASLNMDYAKYYFRAEVLRAYFAKKMMLVTRASLSQNLLKNLPVLLPPDNEQQRIAEYLDTRCAEIDSIIDTKKEQLSTLAEYRKSLIYEYVTGKKEVPA